MWDTGETNRRSKMATCPGFTYYMFNDIFKYITSDLSSNRNCKLNTTSKNRGKLRLCYEYFQKWIVEQAIPFKKLTKTNKTKYFPDSSADIFIYLKSGCMCLTEVIQQFWHYSEERFDLLIGGQLVERMIEKIFSFFSSWEYKPPGFIWSLSESCCSFLSHTKHSVLNICVVILCADQL